MAIIDFQFTNQTSELTQSHPDIELLYCMDGQLKFTLEDKHFILKKDDFVVVNVDKNHSYTSDGEVLGARLLISYSELSNMTKKSMIFFWCNSVLDNNEAVDELRRILKKIISEQYLEDGKDTIYLNSLYYEMLHILFSDFLLNEDDKHFDEETQKFDARKHEIAEYIRLNFDKQISLDDLSKQLFLSYAYLSKFIKKQFGMGFAEYLNSVRLNYASSQMLHSDQSAARIAMESGFASSAAMNKAFREKFDMTPTEYRRKWMKKTTSADQITANQTDIRAQLDKHFSTNTTSSKRDRKQAEERVVLHDVKEKTVLKKSWNKMVNMGTFRDLLESEMQKHVLILKEELGFKYVRLWDLFDPEFYIDNSEYGYSFDRLDHVLDFLLENDLKPYIELRPKPKRIMLNHLKDVLHRPNPAFHDTLQETEQFLRHFMVHLVNRYHTEELESWYFELWNSEPEEILLQPEEASTVMSVKDYLERFDLVAGILRSYIPMVRIGGGGFSLRYGKEVFANFLIAWKHRTQKPDFISAYCYPYTSETIVRERNQSRNADFLQETLLYMKQAMIETDFPTQTLHVTEWNFSVSSRNVLNDHCMKGAYLVRNMIDSIDLADMMGYWVASDLYAAHRTSRQLLSGSGGLLAKSGIRKPSFYAFDFMNHLGKYLLKKDEHYIISDNGAGNYRIVCHNLKNLNHQYGMLNENEISLLDQNNLFEDLKKHTIHFDLPGVDGARYKLRIRSLNQKNGSLQDEWIAMSSPKDLWPEDMEYLSRITTPRMVYQDCICEHGRLSFDVTLEPNEICYIHINFMYS